MISLNFKIWMNKSLNLQKFLVAIFFLLLSVVSFAQSRQSLEKQRIKLQKEIKEINSLLFKSQQKEKTLLSDLSDLDKRIRVRTRLIETIHKETKQISIEIKENQKEVDQLEGSP